MTEKAIPVLGDLDLALELGTEIIESGRLKPELRQKLCDPELRKVVVPLVIALMERILIPAPKKRGGEYLVYVDYAIFPSRADLGEEFSGDDSVSWIFDGRRFYRHASCENIDEAPGYRIMLIKHFDCQVLSEQIIAEMDREGYRPAIEKEARAFAKAHPELQSCFRIAAIGSFAMYDNRRCSVLLRNAFGGRQFDHYEFDSGWHADIRFLFVRM